MVMLKQLMLAKDTAPERTLPGLGIEVEALGLQRLTGADESAVLAFLAKRPTHTVIMTGLIQDNGLISPLNRGSFYACRGREGRLAGVGLIGEITLLEVRTEAALAAFARCARQDQTVSTIIGERERVALFWRHYTADGPRPHQRCRELLFELRWPVQVREPVAGLRLATLEHIEAVMAVHAEMAVAESGRNPLKIDPAGFRQRCVRRIEQGRTWVLLADDRVIFKAEIVSETPAAIYLEGLYVNPAERGKGYGLRCLSQLSRDLLTRSKSICLLVNEQNHAAQALYRKARYQFRSYYDTIFLRPQST
jgi:uncharacterized protein